jgi:hypothetical protein
MEKLVKNPKIGEKLAKIITFISNIDKNKEVNDNKSVKDYPEDSEHELAKDEDIATTAESRGYVIDIKSE